MAQRHTIEQLMALETEVWDALLTGDAAADARRLSDDFLGVYPSGFADKADHVGQLATGPSVAEYALTEARLLMLGEETALLAYRAEWRRWQSAAGSQAPSPPQTMYVTSIWQRRDGEWRNIFSQDTPAQDDGRS